LVVVGAGPVAVDVTELESVCVALAWSTVSVVDAVGIGVSDSDVLTVAVAK
jgi:hypothetical protein